MKRKERTCNEVDPAQIQINVDNTKYSKEKKEQLYIFATRFNELLFKSGIHQEKFAEMVGIGVTSISKYRNGKLFPNMEFIEKIAKGLNVSSEFLLGKSAVKDYSYEELNKMFSFNDNAIDTLSCCFNKEYLNYLFDGERDTINFFLENLKEYVDVKIKHKESTDTLNKFWYLNQANEKVFYLAKALIDLINENIENKR